MVIGEQERFACPSHWLVLSSVAKGQFTPKQPRLYLSQPPRPANQPSLHLRFLLVFAKQPCERNKIILKSIIWWEF